MQVVLKAPELRKHTAGALTERKLSLKFGKNLPHCEKEEAHLRRSFSDEIQLGNPGGK